MFPELMFANHNYKRVTRYYGKQTRILRHASSLHRHPSLEAKSGDRAKVHRDDRDRRDFGGVDRLLVNFEQRREQPNAEQLHYETDDESDDDE